MTSTQQAVRRRQATTATASQRQHSKSRAEQTRVLQRPGPRIVVSPRGPQNLRTGPVHKEADNGGGCSHRLRWRMPPFTMRSRWPGYHLLERGRPTPSPPQVDLDL